MYIKFFRCIEGKTRRDRIRNASYREEVGRVKNLLIELKGK
jgi:hypothetical protein